MILLILSFLSGFQWYPIREASIDENLYNVILNSNEGSSIIMKYGGEENLVKSTIHLGASIFKGGMKVLLPKEFKIKQIPKDIKLLKRHIEMESYDRYSALYKGSEFKEEWNELKRETESKLGISSLDSLPLEEARLLFPERIPPRAEEREKMEKEVLEEEEKEESITYPGKNYFSFLLIEEKGRERLLPVILHLSPVEEKLEGFKRIEETYTVEKVEREEEGGER